MARPDLTVIGPDPAAPRRQAVTLAAGAAAFGLPALASLSVADAPKIAVYALLAVAAALATGAAVALLRPGATGLTLTFPPGGMEVTFRRLFRPDRRETIRWEDVARLTVIRSLRWGDSLMLTPARTATWRRLVLPVPLSSADTATLLDRMLSSAAAAGLPYAPVARMDLRLAGHEAWEPRPT